MTAIALALFVAGAAAAVPLQIGPADAPPGGIQLLAGWTHKTEQGIDTSVGRIKRADGLEIVYDIGALAGSHASNLERPYRWTRTQTVHGNPVQITLRTTGYLEILFRGSSANFAAKVASDLDIAEVLLIVLSYRPENAPVWGVYSNVSSPDAAAEPKMEVSLDSYGRGGFGGGGHYALVQMWGPDGPELPVVVPLSGIFQPERVEFTVTIAGKAQRFTGAIKGRELVGTLEGRRVRLRQRDR